MPDMLSRTRDGAVTSRIMAASRSADTTAELALRRRLWGALRGATNVYYAIVRSAIYLPRGGDTVPSGLMEALEDPAVASVLSLFRQLDQTPTPQLLKTSQGALLRPFTDAQISAGLALLDVKPEQADAQSYPTDDQETSFRRAEFAALRTSGAKDRLKTTSVPVSAYAGGVMTRFSRISLVEKLRETRAFTGFARIIPEDGRTLDDRKADLWVDRPDAPLRWLPAYLVYGEGIYLEIDEATLKKWEQLTAVAQRVDSLVTSHARASARRGTRPLALSPRFVLLHTLAHVLMNQFIFECGYGTASLRERLYVSNEAAAPMGGVLIYTAAGDAEGTMGGLVRMGRPGNLEPVLERAIENARWCSADPVCMELGATGGQGPDSCNLAACHNCGLVPETSCEQFNRFLDRALLIGSTQDERVGFFSDRA